MHRRLPAAKVDSFSRGQGQPLRERQVTSGIISVNEGFGVLMEFLERSMVSSILLRLDPNRRAMHQIQARRDILRLIGSSVAAAALERIAGAKAEVTLPTDAVIRTVLEDVRPEALAGGATLFHEHLSISYDSMMKLRENFQALLATPGNQGSTLPPPARPWFMEDLGLMVAEMRAAMNEGVACIVDGGHPDMGRDLQFLKQLSTRSGMPIVAGFGYYAQPFYPPEIALWSEEQITHELLRQARTEPVGALGEIGTWDVMTPTERKVFRAVGRAQIATGLAVFTHTNFGKGAMEQLDVLESVAVKPERVAIGHVGGLTDPQAEMLKAICRRGAFVGFDRQGGPSDSTQLPAVMALLEAGYAKNLLFSSDFSFASDLKRNGGPGYAKTVTVFTQKLREAGVQESTLHLILVDNPRRFLAFVPKKQLSG
jgi:phosphotriesterase-related protein